MRKKRAQNRRIFLICLPILFFVNLMYGQTLRKEIYTFEVGDYFEVQYISDGPSLSGPTLLYDHLYHILARSYNVDSSEVTYSVERDIYHPALPFPGSVATFELDTISFSHLNLNDTFVPTHNEATFGKYHLDPIFYFEDTSGCYDNSYEISYTTCKGSNIWSIDYWMLPSWPFCSIEPRNSYYYVKQGAGGPYGYRARPGDPTSSSSQRQLVYYKKNGVECGTLKSYYVGLEETTQNNIRIFPQPTDMELNITSDIPIKRVEIIDFKGTPIEKIESPNHSKIRVENLRKGIYFLRIETINGEIQLKRIIKI